MLFSIQAYRMAISTFNKFLWQLGVLVPSSVNDANWIEKLEISLNLNVATSQIGLCDHEEARNHCGLVLRIDFYNAKA